MWKLLLKENLSADEKRQIIDLTAEYYGRHLNPGFLKFKKSSDSKAVEWGGHGATMVDIHGRRFLDCLGGYGIYALGHRPQEVIDALEQVYKRIGLYSQELLNPFQAFLAKKLADLSPGAMKYSYFHSGGAESNDAAIKLARLATGRTRHISMSQGFHGKTMGSLSATNREPVCAPFKPLVPGFVEVEWNNLEALEAAMSNEIASVIVEPIQGEGGINLPSDGYLKGVRELCDKHGALLHFDEIQTGFGRTGKWFGAQHWGVEADIMTLGKALGGGVFPISAVHGNERAWHRLDENPWWLTNTFGGSAPACACALATIDILERDGVIDQVPGKGEFFLGLLREAASNHPSLIKEVRGIGLFIGVEFHVVETGVKVAKELFARDVLVAHTINNPAVIRIEPPLTITEDEMRQVAARFAACLDDCAG